VSVILLGMNHAGILIIIAYDYIECGEICTCVEGLIFVGNFGVEIHLTSRLIECLHLGMLVVFGFPGVQLGHGYSVLYCTEHIPLGCWLPLSRFNLHGRDSATLFRWRST